MPPQKDRQNIILFPSVVHTSFHEQNFSSAFVILSISMRYDYDKCSRDPEVYVLTFVPCSCSYKMIKLSWFGLTPRKYCGCFAKICEVRKNKSLMFYSSCSSVRDTDFFLFSLQHLYEITVDRWSCGTVKIFRNIICTACVFCQFEIVVLPHTK